MLILPLVGDLKNILFLNYRLKRLFNFVGKLIADGKTEKWTQGSSETIGNFLPKNKIR